jgi:hypothetical protein
MRVANSATIVSGAERDTLRTELNAFHLAELVTSLLSFNAMESKATLDIIQETEVLVGALNGDNVHEASGEGGISAHLSVNSNNTLMEDQGNLTTSESVFETIAE